MASHSNSSSSEAMPATFSSSPDVEYDQRFSLVDGMTGEPLANRAYRIKWSGGLIDGRTNSAGFTEKVGAETPEEVTIEVFAEGL